MHQTDGQHEDDSEDDHLDDSEYKLKKSLQGTTVLTMSTCSMTVNDGNQLQTMDNYN
ncbi:8284_t:CDS:1, partial [Paraglomus brasilianum]